MAEKDVSSAQVAHLQRDRQVDNFEHAQQRTTITDDIPLQEALENHLDEDPKRLRRIKMKIDLRLTGMLAILYTCAFIDRSNLGNVSDKGDSLTQELLLIFATGQHCWYGRCSPP